MCFWRGKGAWKRRDCVFKCRKHYNGAQGMKEKYAPERKCLLWGPREGRGLVVMDQKAVI